MPEKSVPQNFTKRRDCVDAIPFPRRVKKKGRQERIAEIDKMLKEKGHLPPARYWRQSNWHPYGGRPKI